MSLRGKFKQPLYKEDLMPVIKQGIFVTLIGGLLIGSIDLFIIYATQGWTWIRTFWVIFAMLLARRIKRSYFEYHIWYSVLSVVFFILGFYLINIVSEIGVLIIYNITDPMMYLSILNPLPYFSVIFPFGTLLFGSAASILQAILDVLFFVIAIFCAYRYSK